MINQDKITKAWFFASRVHIDQKYPGEELPYLTHLGNVMMEVMAVSSSLEDAELAVCCAILHDTIEDAEVSHAELKNEFGLAVADGVMALTKNETLATKREQMIDSLKRIKLQPKSVWAVKMADRISNLGEPPHYWTVEKREAYRDEAQIIWDYLNEGNEILADRLSAKIDKYKSYLLLSSFARLGSETMP